jgi:hypothetical protein
MKEFITPEELAIKLYKKKPYWFAGKPKVYVVGTKGTIGVIRFSFPDQEVQIGVYLYDKQIIKNIANKAVNEFSDYLNDWNMERLAR